MINGLGIDLVKNDRISNSINEDFINMILTSKEKEIYFKRKGTKQLEFLCGRFAAKEAIVKAISKYENPHFLEIEILNNPNGSPFVKYKNYNIEVSISHEKKYTIASAIVIL